MMRLAPTSTFALLVALSALPTLGQPQGQAAVPAGEPADFRDFVETARARGMSEYAESGLRMVASVQAQATLMRFKKNEGGGYTTWYSIAFCPKPGADPEEVRKIRAELRDKEEAALSTMRKWADLDGSGFISTQEGSRLRHLYEFGRRALFAVNEEKTRDGKVLAEALRMPLADFVDMAKGYRELRERYGEEFGPALTLDLPADAAPAPGR